jgi:hypothetical protein
MGGPVDQEMSSKTGCSPVALFTFNRPDHTRRTIDALRGNELAVETPLTIFCDGPRSEADAEAVARVREIARSVDGFAAVQVVERTHNLGLARSIIRGVTEMLETAGTVIVLEDDLVTSPFFLVYMNDALREYADEERVLSICGYSFPTTRPLPDSFFLPGAYPWGWATWRRSWALYEHDAPKLLAEIVRRNLVYELDLDGGFPYTQLMQRAVANEGASWAMRWIGTAFLHDKLSLYPGVSLIQNIGNDGSGTNAGSGDGYRTRLAERPLRIATGPPQPDEFAKSEFRAFHVGLMSGSPRCRWYHRVARLLPQSLERRLYSALVRRSLRRHSARVESSTSLRES